MHSQRMIQAILPLFLFGAASSGLAETPADFLGSFATEAREQAGNFAGFSAARGQAFFQQAHGREWSCASCHTKNPATPGRHAKTNKTIAAIAPAANTKRFTSTRKVDKWFRRNCNDVVGRACTGQEKGDVLTYLMSVK